MTPSVENTGLPKSIAVDGRASDAKLESSELAGPARPLPLLKEVSRSFYLTIRVLPVEVRSQIALAYLLARATDTVADTRAVPVESRLAILSALRRRIHGETVEPLSLAVFVERRADSAATPSGAELILLQRI